MVDETGRYPLGSVGIAEVHRVPAGLQLSAEARASALAGVRTSGFRANVSRARSFLGRLLVEAHALTFVELFEVSRLDGTAMEEPLLATIVTNEPETTISDESFNRTVRHVDSPPRAMST